MYKLPVINKYWDVMYKMIELQCCMLYMKAVKKVKLKSSQGKNFLYFFNSVSNELL